LDRQQPREGRWACRTATLGWSRSVVIPIVMRISGRRRWLSLGGRHHQSRRSRCTTRQCRHRLPYGTRPCPQALDALQDARAARMAGPRRWPIKANDHVLEWPYTAAPLCRSGDGRHRPARRKSAGQRATQSSTTRDRFRNRKEPFSRGGSYRSICPKPAKGQALPRLSGDKGSLSPVCWVNGTRWLFPPAGPRRRPAHQARPALRLPNTGCSPDSFD
jgi:hypothetical protein